MVSTQQSRSLELVDKALAEIRRGKMVILTDDEDRENEGDLVMAAEKVTPEAINFMARHGRGLICLSLTEQRIQQLGLPLMVQDNSSPFQTAFTVSIEAARGVSTGISAADRAKTIKAAVAMNAKPTDLVRPGHIFPLRARNGGVLVRTGQTEGSVDLARLAGLMPAGVICEVMKEDGTMARRPDLVKFAKKHKLVLLSVADLISWRLARERLIKRIGVTEVERPFGKLLAYAYTSDVDPTVHLALVKGDLSAPGPVMVRVHRGTLLADVLDSAAGDGSLKQAMDAINKEGRGVLVYLRKHVGPQQALQTNAPSNDEVVPGHSEQTRLREFGVGAQILTDLGLSQLKLLTNHPKQIVGLDSYGLKLVAQVPLGNRPARRKVR